MKGSFFSFLHGLARLCLKTRSSTPGAFRATRTFALALLFSAGLAACGDPGTGGSGLPSAAGSASNASAPAAADFQISGTIQALTATSVTINGQSWASSLLDIVLYNGSSGTFSALSVGQTVGINTIANSSPTRWTLRILSP